MKETPQSRQHEVDRTPSGRAVDFLLGIRATFWMAAVGLAIDIPVNGSFFGVTKKGMRLRHIAGPPMAIVVSQHPWAKTRVPVAQANQKTYWRLLESLELC